MKRLSICCISQIYIQISDTKKDLMLNADILIVVEKIQVNRKNQRPQPDIGVLQASMEYVIYPRE